MGTLISEETIYNTEAATKTLRFTYQSLEGFGSEVNGMANQTYKISNGVYEYSGEQVYFWNDFGSGPGGGGGGTSETQLSISGAATISPLETHPFFNNKLSTAGWDMWNRWKANPEDPKNANPPQTDAKKNSLGYFDPSLYEAGTAYGDLYKQWMRGVKEYYEPRVVVRLTKFETTPPNLTHVGKIDTPPIHPGGMINFLLNSAEGSFRSSVGQWENTYEWLGSRTGWDAELYAQ